MKSKYRITKEWDPISMNWKYVPQHAIFFGLIWTGWVKEGYCTLCECFSSQDAAEDFIKEKRSGITHKHPTTVVWFDKD